MTGHRARAAALTATSLGFAVVQLDVSVVNVAIEPIRASLGGTVSSVQWVVNAYTVVFAALMLSAGAVGDRIGAKRVFVAGFGLFTAASLGCGLAPNLAALIAFRAMQGVGAAVLVPCSLSVLNHAYPDGAARTRAVGLWAAGASVGLSGGPIVGGALTAALNWRWIFLINLPLGLVGVALTLRYADETSRSPQRRFDVVGALIGMVTLAALAAATIEGGRAGFTAPLVLAGFVVAAVGLVGFVLVEARRRSPMLPMSLFASRTFSLSAAIGFAVNIVFYGLIFVLSLYFQTALHYSALRTGLAFAPTTGIVLFANVGAGRLVAWFGTRLVVASGAVILVAALAGLLGANGSTPYPTIVVQLMGVGLGLGVIIPAITSALLGSVERSRSGVASATLNTARQSGSVVGVALFGSFAAAGVVPGLHRTLAVGIGLAALVIVLAVALDGRTDAT